MKKQVLAGMVAAATMGFFTPLTSHAFGLGKIEVMSALNEPFKAEIGLTALQPDEKDNLQVKMASDAEFTKAGLNRSILLSQMQFDIVESNGRDKILITSKQPIKEPFLDFLITATAGSGILLREYTVLLDPPEYVTQAVRGTERPSEPTTPSTQTSTTDRYLSQNTDNSPGSYAVKRSDTLWNVAANTRPDNSITVHQMMMALLNANPRAFKNQNVNGLQAGVTLQIPPRDEITAMSPAEARAAFTEQNSAWKNRNQQPVSSAPVAQVATQSEDQNAEADTPSAQTQTDQTDSEASTSNVDTSDAASSDGRLKLVAPEDAATSEDDASPNVAGNEDIKKLTEQLTLAQETIEAQTQENIDFKQRMDAMEEQLETMRRLISLKDADLARLQSMLEEEDPALADQAAMIVDSEAPSAPSADSNDTPAETELEDQEPGSDTEDETEQPSPVQTAADEDVISTTAQALNLEADEVHSTIDQVKQFLNDNKLPAALGLLLVLLLLWLLARRNNRDVSWDEAVKKMDKGADNEVSDTTVVAPVTGDDITDAPLSEQEHEQEKSVAELVEQADMFVGYADYVQARNSLEEARNIEPDNTLVAYKLLFVLYKQQQTEAFISLAEDTPFDTESFEWSEVKQWGQELSPAHYLFVEQQTATQDDEVNTDDSMTDFEPEPEPEPAQTAAEDEDKDNDHLEFNLADVSETGSESQSEPQPEPETEAQESTDKQVVDDLDDDLLSFDTNFGFDDKDELSDSEQEDSASLNLDIAEEGQREETLSFDEDFATETAEAEQDLPDENDFTVSTEDEPDLEFDIGDLDDIDEAETKLDLAAAYVDMGDPEGARSILNEVLAEGNEEQKNRAQALLNSLS